MRFQKPREIAVRVLLHREKGADYVENVLDRELPSLAPADRALCQEIVYGVVRRQATLDWLIAQKTEGRAQKTALQILLRLGLYQMFWLDRVPDHAAVNETVELARQMGFGPQSGFVNALLRGCARERDAVKKSLEELRTAHPHLGYSHPGWLCDRWRQRWGDGKLRQLLEWNNTPPKTYARINTLKIDAGRLLEQWRNEDVEYDFIRRDWFEENLIFELRSHPPLTELPSFQQGLFYIQDPGTLLAVSMLDPQPGETVLDFCAAPGGKTTYMAQLMRNQGRVVAQERQYDRLPLLRENCERLGATCAEVVRSDGPVFPELNVHFDRVLVDAPCSNTGVMRRRVDLRWRIRVEEIERLRAVQLELLNEAASILKPNGVLVYSTCSLEPEENGGVVNKFLAGHPEFKLESERELLPFEDGVDGAFVGRLRKTPR
ncbi:MAG TPA: 16S rRNA (cytosine(967)-C(5))-methyltransferase RsmB [Candidatus Angelobacter sp.]|nr:16S rRNA (cytosine(967)-C(5))-methyltransferase RsmB [Candidatus Angelobacter sp.]